MKFTHICNPENRRAQFFREACRKADFPAPDEIAWTDLLKMKSIPEFQSDAIRIESPGENFEVEQLLIHKGGGPPAVEEDRGRIRYQVPWFRGWQAILSRIEERNPDARFMNQPAEIAEMFDKPTAQQRISDAGIPVPEFICHVESFAQLHADLSAQNIRRVFVKPAHSSSASGVIALQLGGGDRILATVPAVVEGNEEGDGPRVYNNLRLRHYRNLNDVSQLVDALSGERLFAERWFPKASLDGRVFDLRVLVIGGKPRHIVVRTSRSPITNLHLGNERGDVEQVRAGIGESKWAEFEVVCKKTAACFPRCHYVAVDLMVGSGFNRCAVAEVNAFGDLIPNVLSDGEDTYEAELRSFASILER